MKIIGSNLVALLLVLLPLCLTVTLTEAKTRGERLDNKRRKLVDIDRLRDALGLGTPYPATPYKNELNVPSLTGRNDARARQFQMTHEIYQVAADTTDTEPMLHVVLPRSEGKGGGYKMGMMMGASRSGSSKSKGKGGSSKKSKGSKDSRSIPKPKSYEEFPQPTLFPTFPGPTTPPPLTDKPTCAPNTGVFPSDVSDFFQAPAEPASELEKEIDSVVNEIQVPDELREQCRR